MAGMGGKGGGQGGQQGGHDDMAVFAFIAVGILALWLIWTKARNIVVWVEFGPIWANYWLLDKVHLLNDQFGHNNMVFTKACLDGRYDPFDVDWDNFTAIARDLGRRMRWVFVVLMVAMAVVATFKMKGDGYRRKWTLTGKALEGVYRFAGIRIKNKKLIWIVNLLTKITLTRKILVSESKSWQTSGMSFMHYQAAHWRVALAGAHFDPNAVDEAQAPQMKPPHWLRAHGIKLTRRDGLDEAAAEEAFKQQLGPIWSGVLNAPLHVQAIAVLSALNRKRDKGKDRLRDALVECYVLRPDKVVQEVAALIKPYLENKAIREGIDRVCGQHAFQNTAILGLYGWGGPNAEWNGGVSGVLATAWFRWLKKVDRPLWYCLNNVGRRKFHVEAAGVVSHYQAERVVGGPLSDPQVNEALDGIVDYLDIHGIDELEEFFRVDKDF